MGSVDKVLRGVAAVIALAALLVIAANPKFHVNFNSDAVKQMSGDQLQRKANARTGGYTFLLKSDDAVYPGRWCQGTIPYTLDLSQVAAAGMDPAAEADRWATVLREWEQAARGHYRFVYAGQRSLKTKDDGQLDLDSIEAGTIGITYVHDDSGVGDPAYRAAAVHGRTAGNGGLQVTSNGAVPGGSLIGDRGFVMIDAQDAAALNAEGMRQALYQHESGHALGLGHVRSDTSIMNGTLSDDRLELASGDIEGLRELTAMPCQP